MGRSRTLALAALLLLGPAPPAVAQQRGYRLPATDLRQRVVWGSSCDGPGGTGLSFGGQDQRADDGRPHTRVRVRGAWRAIHRELRSGNPLQKDHDRCRALAGRQKGGVARARSLYFKGLTASAERKFLKADLLPRQEGVNRDLAALVGDLRDAEGRLKGYEAGQARHARGQLEAALGQARGLSAGFAGRLTAAAVGDMSAVQAALEQAAEALDAEPPPRALSPIAYDARTRWFVLFGGDHLDYLTNDTWAFDPARGRWLQRHPAAAPAPRANHALKAAGDGKVVLSGGYTYASSTDYLGGQYRDLDDGDWTYDVAADAWAGGKGTRPGARVYRTGPFHPGYFLRGPRPDAAACAARLRGLPANTWVAVAPPRLPRLNRDWGTAVLDPGRDLLLRWAGGHSAHGGTDVLHYHLATNRWELPFPVEFPLGQLYANTAYPDGFNFNLRPWVTGHTYQSYGYDPVAGKLVFTGRPRHAYVYDPDAGDWAGRLAKPRAMAYDSCFYTLTASATPRGLVTWTQRGDLFRLDGARMRWAEVGQRGGRLPGSVVDNSTAVHDSKRNRLVFARKGYGPRSTYDGTLYTLALDTGEVGKLSPRGRAGAAAIPYLCQMRYDPDHDLMLVGATLPPEGGGSRRTPAYDCARDRWVSLKVGGRDPSGKAGRNVSLGLVYDARRKLFWAVDADSHVYVLRLDPASADLRPLE